MNSRLISFFCLGAFFILSSLSVKKPQVFDSAGIFSCTINDKPYVIHGINAEMRTVTGGFKQLSLSNDLFTSFFFINPSTKEIDLTPAQRREAVVRYTNPINLNLYLPEKGMVKIEVLDEKAKILSGAFEMELIPKSQSGKKIKITNGKLINIPIIYK
jgi:hypothetical protein